MKNKLILFWIIVALALFGAYVIWKKPTSLGLDLVGGSRLVLEAQTSPTVKEITPEIMDSLQYAIENRVNAMGVGETTVQRVGQKRLLVEIPNITDTAKAKEFIGQTAELEFKRPVQNADGSMSWQSTGLTGKDIKKSMVDLLNAGALPVGAEVIQEESVGPTLGQDSIHKSKIAGIVGICAVMAFMIYYYRAMGLISCFALLIYAIINFAIYKLVPVTLTLTGIAGFILSIGMAIDANILIFERTKEELKMGRSLFTAINSGFDRAFTSIFDSNVSTVITCLILYCLGASMVKGFALTLIIGVVLSMFSAITVTKNFMHLAFGSSELKYPQLFGIKKEEINAGFSATETKREKAKFGVLD